jgi:hypothetical protein
MQLLVLILGANPVGAILAFAILVTFIAFLIVLMFVNIPTTNTDLVREMMIALIAAFGTGAGYYLGSSKGSSDKTNLMTPRVPSDGPPAPPQT